MILLNFNLLAIFPLALVCKSSLWDNGICAKLGGRARRVRVGYIHPEAVSGQSWGRGRGGEGRENSQKGLVCCVSGAHPVK